MCGIVGYVGKRQAAPILVDRLDDLSYRGYDSAGLAVVDDGRVEVVKTPGKIENLRAALAGGTPAGNVGVGHTRWATHGAPTRQNAHPHGDCTGALYVVQNGIVENFQELKDELEGRGHRFRSETDTEVIIHIIEEYYREENDLTVAVREAAKRLEGSFAIAVVAAGESRIVCARFHAPLIIGVGSGENFVASDITALLKDTNKVYVLENGDVVSVQANRVDVDTFIKPAPKPVNQRQLTIVDWRPEDVSKGPYPHYMLKEIYEQPQSVAKTLKGRVREGEIALREMSLSPEQLRRAKDFHFVACGTAFHAGLFAKYLAERVLRVPVAVDVASEFRYRDPAVGPDAVVIAISQSGETADTIASVEESRHRGARTVAVVNVRGSTLAREADAVLYTKAGPEIAVASTKAFTAQLAALVTLVFYIGDQRHVVYPAPRESLVEGLFALPDKIGLTLDIAAARTRQWAAALTAHADCYFLGRNMDEPIAREAALKLKEISYIHAEAYAAGELKHGTIALISPGTPVIAFITQNHVRDKMLSNLHEVVARGAKVFAVVTGDGDGLGRLCEDVMVLPPVAEVFAPVLAAVPAQLLAYEAAVALGRDVDQPRNLAKSVTVE